MTTTPFTFSEDGTSMLALSSVQANTGRLVRLDLATGGTEVLAEDPDTDVTDIRLNPDTREPQIVTFAPARVASEISSSGGSKPAGQASASSRPKRRAASIHERAMLLPSPIHAYRKPASLPRTALTV